MTDDASGVDRWSYSVRWAARQYELALLGHLDNAVYLNWVEQVAIEHVEALGSAVKRPARTVPALTSTVARPRSVVDVR